MYIKYLKKEKEKEIQQIQLLQLQSALKGTETIKEYIYIYIYFGIVKYWAIHLFIKCDNNY